MPPLYPVFLKLADKNILVVGAGEVALRKVRGLMQCKAKVTVVAPKIHPELRALAADGAVTLHLKRFHHSDLQDMTLVMVATDNELVNRNVVKEAHHRNIWVNVADVPDLCDFYLPAIIERGPLQVAISTSGTSPLFARRFKEALTPHIPGYIKPLLELMEEMRIKVKHLFPADQKRRQQLLDTILTHGAETLARGADATQARQRMLRVIENIENKTNHD